MPRIRLLLLLVLLGCAGAANAEVWVHFQSKDFASTFPHAFVRFTGTDEATGKPVDINYGFTPERLSPGILFGPVRGMIETVDPVYVSRSDLHFSLQLTDDQYRMALGIVEKWRNAPQPNYRLNSRNCVHFVAEIATALGFYAPPVRELIKKPKSFLRKVTQDNAVLIEQWAARHALAARLTSTSSPVASVQVPATPAE